MQALLRMHALLHINEEEALSYTHSTSIQQAATMLYAQSHAPIIITLGANGVYFYDGMQAFTIPSPSVQVTDTIGAGDTHIGACPKTHEKGLANCPFLCQSASCKSCFTCRC